jgi:2-haloacid dehalogenase
VAFRPRFISFDCYGTLIDFAMGPAAKTLFEDRVPPDRMPAFLNSFRAYRLDEVLGDWKPFREVIDNAIRKSCKGHGVPFSDADAVALYDAIPTFEPHPHVVEVLKSIVPHIPLVLLSNSMNDLIRPSVIKLRSQFHDVITAEQARAYKPRMQAFEAMFDRLGCGPEHLMHVSSSFRYDLMTASDLGFMATAFIDRNHEPAVEGYGASRITDIRQLPGLVGL